MRAKDIAAVLMSAASLLTAAAGFVKAIRTETKAEAADERLYDQAATGVADNADELRQLRERLDQIEKRK